MLTRIQQPHSIKYDHQLAACLIGLHDAVSFLNLTEAEYSRGFDVESIGRGVLTAASTDRPSNQTPGSAAQFAIFPVEASSEVGLPDAALSPVVESPVVLE